MICNTCGVQNDNKNKYCVNCGEELIEPESITANACPHCGTENDEGNRFCISCGYELIKKTDKKQNNHIRPKKNKNQLRRESKNDHKKRYARKTSTMKNLKTFWITAGVIIVSLLIATTFDVIFDKHPEKQQYPVEQKSSNPVIEANVYEIASKFVCSCGTCNEESLETCTCTRAIEERQFIRDYLEKNQKPDDIVLAIANKYGWMKSEFASDYKVDPSRVWNRNELKVTKDIISTNPALIGNIATISDKYTIYSAFNCPCGQCSIDELKDCNCKHPKGATEVKSFIDQKISENLYTIREIIDMVDQKYGGKKI